MNEKLIQDALWYRLQRKGHNLIVPNYTPLGWFECDIFSITAAGLMVEHEIKVSIADFRADALKCKNEWNGIHGEGAAWDKRSKHSRLIARDAEGPTRFFYVVPTDMVKNFEVPEWAGLIYVNEHPQHRTLHFSSVKDAPKLHGGKCPEVVTNHALGVMYWRFWRLRTRLKTDDSAKVESEVAF